MSRRGVVVARHRRHVTVEDENRLKHRCLVRGRATSPLAGDEVEWTVADDGTPIIEKLLPRRSTLIRIDSRGRPEAIAANVSQMLVVTAPSPNPDWFLVDRYLAAAELTRLSAAVVWNKVDLGPGGDALSTYVSIGYPVFRTSTRTGAGIDALAAAMAHRRSVLVGQSGVGKSSLLNALLGEKLQTVGALTGKGGHGKHTTTTAVLYRGDRSIELIDSPGVRHYAPHLEPSASVDAGFRELKPLLGQCRFDDCRHIVEPDCAVRAALETGRVAPGRFESYRKLLAMLDALR